MNANQVHNPTAMVWSETVKYKHDKGQEIQYFGKTAPGEKPPLFCADLERELVGSKSLPVLGGSFEHMSIERELLKPRLTLDKTTSCIDVEGESLVKTRILECLRLCHTIVEIESKKFKVDKSDNEKRLEWVLPQYYTQMEKVIESDNIDLSSQTTREIAKIVVNEFLQDYKLNENLEHLRIFQAKWCSIVVKDDEQQKMIPTVALLVVNTMTATLEEQGEILKIRESALS